MVEHLFGGARVNDDNPVPMAHAIGAPAIPTIVGAPSAADVNVGALRHTATTPAATLLTVPAGKTWVGRITVNCSVSKSAGASGAASVRAVIATAGADVAPAAGTLLDVTAMAGANATTGTAGSEGHQSVTIPVTVVAPAGNAVTLTLATTVTSATEAQASASAIGANQ